MKINARIVKAAARYVSNYFARYLDIGFTYHNTRHTTFVAKAVSSLCAVMGVGEHQTSILSVAAWFHDLGFTKCIEGHEAAGAALAEDFLKGRGIDQEEIARVKACILATRYPQQPTTLSEQIICDADLMYLGDKHFFETSALLRKEWALTKAMTFTDAQWRKLNIEFVSAHQFHTWYCRSYVERAKEKNVKLLESK